MTENQKFKCLNLPKLRRMSWGEGFVSDMRVKNLMPLSWQNRARVNRARLVFIRLNLDVLWPFDSVFVCFHGVFMFSICQALLDGGTPWCLLNKYQKTHVFPLCDDLRLYLCMLKGFHSLHILHSCASDSCTMAAAYSINSSRDKTSSWWSSWSASRLMRNAAAKFMRSNSTSLGSLKPPLFHSACLRWSQHHAIKPCGIVICWYLSYFHIFHKFSSASRMEKFKIINGKLGRW